MKRAFRIIFGLLPLIALLRQLSVHLSLGFSLVNFFSYFTNLSNLLAGCVLLLSAAPWAGASSQRMIALLRTVSTINMVLVGVVFTTLLRNTDLGSLLPWVNWVDHYLMPCIVALDWMIWPPNLKQGRDEILRVLAFPLLYLTYVLVRGHLSGWYPYYFLDTRTTGAPGVVAYVVSIAAVFVIIGGILIRVSNQRFARSEKSR